MVKCNDGRKHLIVKGYRKKTGQTISRYERSCPRRTLIPGDEEYICCVCGQEYKREEVYNIPVKGETRIICNECADTVHGLL